MENSDAAVTLAVSANDIWKIDMDLGDLVLKNQQNIMLFSVWIVHKSTDMQIIFK